mmetsp:Transcript_3027/g.6751  ORF Transcript_3027/g.6751 Transcript_3027/m.6751 type:complete len:302 (-) Transcript_3027:35-940(-)
MQGRHQVPMRGAGAWRRREVEIEPRAGTESPPSRTSRQGFRHRRGGELHEQSRTRPDVAEAVRLGSAIQSTTLCRSAGAHGRGLGEHCLLQGLLRPLPRGDANQEQLVAKRCAHRSKSAHGAARQGERELREISRHAAAHGQVFWPPYEVAPNPRGNDLRLQRCEALGARRASHTRWSLRLCCGRRSLGALLAGRLGHHPRLHVGVGCCHRYSGGLEQEQGCRIGQRGVHIQRVEVGVSADSGAVLAEGSDAIPTVAGIQVHVWPHMLLTWKRWRTNFQHILANPNLMHGARGHASRMLQT